MAKSRKAGVVDSFAAIKAAQHAARAKPAIEASPDATGPLSDLQKLGAHVARTVVPAKQLIECYECGYKFQLHGRAASTNCSKCRATLDLTDHVIDGKWSKSFRTAGTIRLAATGVLQGGNLVANDVVLEGAIEVGTIRAMRKVELRPGTQFPQASILAPDLLIAAGATIAFAEPAGYRDVEIFGTFQGRLVTTGVVTVRAGGLIEGDIVAEHLVVEDGGGLKAELRIGSRTPTRQRQ